MSKNLAADTRSVDNTDIFAFMEDDSGDQYFIRFDASGTYSNDIKVTQLVDHSVASEVGMLSQYISGPGSSWNQKHIIYQD